ETLNMEMEGAERAEEAIQQSEKNRHLFQVMEERAVTAEARLTEVLQRLMEKEKEGQDARAAGEASQSCLNDQVRELQEVVAAGKKQAEADVRAEMVVTQEKARALEKEQAEAQQVQAACDRARRELAETQEDARQLGVKLSQSQGARDKAVARSHASEAKNKLLAQEVEEAEGVREKHAREREALEAEVGATRKQLEEACTQARLAEMQALEVRQQEAEGMKAEAAAAQEGLLAEKRSHQAEHREMLHAHAAKVEHLLAEVAAAKEDAVTQVLQTAEAHNVEIMRLQEELERNEAAAGSRVAGLMRDLELKGGEHHSVVATLEASWTASLREVEERALATITEQQARVDELTLMLQRQGGQADMEARRHAIVTDLQNQLEARSHEHLEQEAELTLHHSRVVERLEASLADVESCTAADMRHAEERLGSQLAQVEGDAQKSVDAARAELEVRVAEVQAHSEWTAQRHLAQASDLTSQIARKDEELAAVQGKLRTLQEQKLQAELRAEQLGAECQRLHAAQVTASAAAPLPRELPRELPRRELPAWEPWEPLSKDLFLREPVGMAARELPRDPMEAVLRGQRELGAGAGAGEEDGTPRRPHAEPAAAMPIPSPLPASALGSPFLYASSAALSQRLSSQQLHPAATGGAPPPLGSATLRNLAASGISWGAVHKASSTLQVDAQEDVQ
ncbi:hypothetical protein CYMTET_26355, partial [Cymbomonas tetramitiformis]